MRKLDRTMVAVLALAAGSGVWVLACSGGSTTDADASPDAGSVLGDGGDATTAQDGAVRPKGTFRVGPSLTLGEESLASLGSDGGTGGWGVVVADVDGDGHEDVLAADEPRKRLAFFRGRGDGTFAAAVTTPCPAPRDLLVKDLDGDGRLDVVIGSALETDAHVLRGRGDGTFEAAKALGCSGKPLRVSTGDLGGDGITDIIASLAEEQQLCVLRGAGDGGFAAPAYAPTPRAPYVTALGDVNGDGVLDAVVGTTGNEIVFFNGVKDGGTGLGAPQSVLVRPRDAGVDSGDAATYADHLLPSYVALADLGDGRLSVVVGEFGSGVVSTLAPSPDGGFTAADARRSIVVGPQPYAAGPRDLDGDGKMDVVASLFGGRAVVVLRGHGDGTFTETARYDSEKSGGLAFGDLDEDGRVDVVVSQFAADRMLVLLGE